MIVQPNVWYFDSIKEQVIFVHLFDVLHENQDFRVYKPEFKGHIKGDRQHYILAHFIEMYGLSFCFLYFYSALLDWWSIVYFHDLLDPLAFEFLQITPYFDAAYLVVYRR